MINMSQKREENIDTEDIKIKKSDIKQLLNDYSKESCLPPPTKEDVKQTMKDLGEKGVI